MGEPPQTDQVSIHAIEARSEPFVSIIVPAFNAASSLPQCLESLLALEYPATRFEIVVVDNGSTDESAEIIRRFPVTCVQECSVRNAYVARNRGIRRAAGQVLAFTDSDCVVDAHWLSEGVAALADDRVGGVGGEISGYPQKSRVGQCIEQLHYLSARYTIKNRFLPYAQAGNVFYRRSVFEAIGLFDADLRFGGDADLAWRMQLYTHWSLAFRPAALVWHHHQETLAGFYRQRYRHGVGRAILETKYAPWMKERGLSLKYARSAALFKLGVFFCRHVIMSLIGCIILDASLALREWVAFVGDIGYTRGFLDSQRPRLSI